MSQEINWQEHLFRQFQFVSLSLYSKGNIPSFTGAISKHIDEFIQMSAAKDLFHQTDIINKL